MQYVTRFGHSLLFDQPTGTARDSEEQYKEQRGRYRRNAQLPPPFRSTELHRSYNVVRKVGEQNSKDNVELKQTHEAAPPLGGRNLRNIHRTEHGGTAYAESPDESEKHESGPVPRKGTTKRGMRYSTAWRGDCPGNFVSGNSSKHGTEDRPSQRDGNSQAQCGRREVESIRQRMRRARDDGSVESEEQAPRAATTPSQSCMEGS